MRIGIAKTEKTNPQAIESFKFNEHHLK